jgi:preprotein translocase subunit YajC
MNHVKESSNYFLRFDQILAIENFKKHLILALINFYIAIFAIYRQQKKKRLALQRCWFTLA